MEGMVKKVLITGSEGYIGSVLIPLLIDNGFEVIGIDSCLFRDGNLNNTSFKNYRLIKKDIRDISKKDFNENIDAIVHLAALSNDPLGMIDENLTYEINYRASVRLAKLAREAGIKRFIFSSSCSVYGKNDNILTEDSDVNPQTPYSKSKVLAETEIARLASEDFSPVFLRNATAYGFSPRMRFDIVVNNLTGYAHVENEIKILGDGSPYRPLVHVKDICRVIMKSLVVRRDIIHKQIFNVGDNEENYQIKEIGEHIRKFYSCKVTIAKKKDLDSRSYKVSFHKLNDELNFKINYKLDDGIVELKKIYEQVSLSKEVFYNRVYTRLKQIKYLLKNKIIDSSLKWIEE